ncbi:MAG: hypothetical protein HN348_19275 [Proteobacteria bacterium]|jgi:GNAT superfamily N-acetyltransferase|nr:hypothetical protein [Pseudomonadota bacterium]
MITTVGNRDELKQFLAFPKRLHQDDDHHVPVLEAWLYRRLKKAGPWNDESRLRLFMAKMGNELVGTTWVLRDKAHDKHNKGDEAAFFGFFETIEDNEICDALVDGAATQARSWGAKILRGPRGLSRIDEMGVFIEGHGKPPFLAGHHPPYYRQLLESRGFKKQSDRVAYEIELDDGAGRPKPLPTKLEERANKVDIPGLVIRPVAFRHVRRDLGLAHEVFVDAFRNVPENTPMTRGQFVSVGSFFLAFANTNMLQLATVNGQAAGFALCFPELNEALWRARGVLLPAGWLRFLRGIGGIRTASWKLFGVMPEYRGSGLHALLIRHAIEGIRIAGYNRLEASLIDERNKPMRGIVESAGCTPYRRYRVFELPLD